MGTIITTEQLAERLGDPNLRILDCRYSLADERAGQAAFREAHIPDAQYIDLELDMSAEVIPGKTGRHPLPEREAFADCLCHLGISNESTVVAYDDGVGAFAARLWWMMRWLGHEDVHVLSGGFKAWQDDDLPVTDDKREFPITDFEVGKSLARIVARAEALQDINALLFDARDEARFRGENEPIDPVAGHIPGAVCATFSANVDPSGHLLDPDALRERFEALGATGDREVVCYCGSGVTATHNVLAMVHAGLPEPMLYPGSWSEWITDPKRPVETG